MRSEKALGPAAPVTVQTTESGGPMGSLYGRVAIVTGTSRGVGVGIARELLLEGATVIGWSRSELASLPSASGISGAEGRSAQWVCDQPDYQPVDEFVTG